MKLSLFNEEKISAFLESNCFNDKVFPLYANGLEEEILTILCSEQDLIIERDLAVRFEFPTKQLLQAGTNYSLTREYDFANIKSIYTTLKDLPLALAAKPEFWGILTHKYFFQYILKRSEVAKNNKQWTRKDILRDFYCASDKETPKRCIAMNPIARLWWAGHFSYDKENGQDPFALAHVFTAGNEFNSLILLLCSSVQIGNDSIIKGLLDAICEWEKKQGYELGSRPIRALAIEYGTKYLNTIGALRMVDSLTREEIKELLLLNYQNSGLR